MRGSAVVAESHVETGSAASTRPLTTAVGQDGAPRPPAPGRAWPCPCPERGGMPWIGWCHRSRETGLTSRSAQRTPAVLRVLVGTAGRMPARNGAIACLVLIAQRFEAVLVSPGGQLCVRTMLAGRAVQRCSSHRPNGWVVAASPWPPGAAPDGAGGIRRSAGPDGQARCSRRRSRYRQRGTADRSTSPGRRP